MEAMAPQSWTDDRLEERFDHLDTEIATLRTEVRAGNSELRQEIKSGNAALRREIQEGGAQLRKEMREGGAELRAEMQAGDASLRAELAAQNRALMQAGFGLAAAILAAVLVHLF
jgi:hypothetical protein